MKKNKSGTGFILIGIILLLAALGLSFYNRMDDARAEKDTQEAVAGILQQLEEAVNEPASNIPAENSTGESNESISDRTPVGAFPQSEFGWDEMPVVTVNGIPYLGLISIPSLNLELPVGADFSMELLRSYPCRYAGSVIENNMVIAGHNYSCHFGPLRWIDLNVDVYFTTADGQVLHYIVDNVETMQPTQVEDMLTGDWDLTLFTCTTGGQSRHAVRCIRVKE